MTANAAMGLFESKLQPPWTRPGLVPRTALVDRLVESSAPIISVVAPAGYGKTTLLSHSSGVLRGTVVPARRARRRG